jgi:hypothetical protein
MSLEVYYKTYHASFVTNVLKLTPTFVYGFSKDKFRGTHKHNLANNTGLGGGGAKLTIGITNIIL